jgi:hypothetical protein
VRKGTISKEEFTKMYKELTAEYEESLRRMNVKKKLFEDLSAGFRDGVRAGLLAGMEVES